MKWIWGEQTALRRYEEQISDDEIARLYAWSRDEELSRWSGGAPTDLSLLEFREHVRGERLYAPTNRRAFLIFAHQPLMLIGRIGLFGIDWDTQQGELGIVIGDKGYWGRGYGRDAIQTLLRHTFTTSALERVYLYTFADNSRAQRCFTAVGFRAVDRARRFTPDVGEYDGIQMEITRAAFFEKQLFHFAQTQTRPTANCH